MSHPLFYAEFSNNLMSILLRNATDEGFLAGQILTTEDFDEKWTQIAPEYLADAVQEVIQYPSVSIAWAAYLGMGVALLWDTQWDKHATANDTYKLFSIPRGFDAMDEYIMNELFGVDAESKEFTDLETFFRNSAQTALTLIRKENIPPQSPEAYQIFSDTVTVFFRIGASICLHWIGYKYHPVGN